MWVMGHSEESEDDYFGSAELRNMQWSGWELSGILLLRKDI